MTRVTSTMDVRSIEAGLPTLVDFPRTRAVSTPTDVAQVFLADGEREEHVLTYAELDARARRVAVALMAHGAVAARVLLLFDPGLDFSARDFRLLLRRLRSPCRCIPRSPRHGVRFHEDSPRTRRLRGDGRAHHEDRTGAPRRSRGRDRRRAIVRLVRPGRLAGGLGGGMVSPPTRTRGRCLPAVHLGIHRSSQGVMVTHGNLVVHGDRVAKQARLDATTVVVSWLPVYHDMGLIGAVLIPMQLGCRSILMSPLAFLERPRRWVQAMSRHGGTLSPAPNFAYDLVVRKTTRADRRELDRAYVGGGDERRRARAGRDVRALRRRVRAVRVPARGAGAHATAWRKPRSW